MISDDHFRRLHPTQPRTEKRGWHHARQIAETELFISAVLLVGLFGYLFYNFFVALAAYLGAA